MVYFEEEKVIFLMIVTKSQGQTEDEDRISVHKHQAQRPVRRPHRPHRQTKRPTPNNCGRMENPQGIAVLTRQGRSAWRTNERPCFLAASVSCRSKWTNNVRARRLSCRRWKKALQRPQCRLCVAVTWWCSGYILRSFCAKVMAELSG